jgi:hypothetical protein
MCQEKAVKEKALLFDWDATDFKHSSFPSV